MSDATLSLSILAAVVVLFVWNRFPVELVAVGAALALFFSGVLSGSSCRSSCRARPLPERRHWLR